MKKNVFNLILLPEEPMLGVLIVNSRCVVEEDKIGRVIGLEIGLLFIKLTWIKII